MVDNRKKRCYEPYDKLACSDSGITTRSDKILKTYLKKEEGGDGGGISII